MGYKIFLALLLFIGLISCGQNKEQQNKIDDDLLNEKGIMNSREMKEMEEQDKEFENDRDKKSNKDTGKSKKTSNSSDDWYWKNTIESTNNRFETWNGGQADIVMMYRINPGEQSHKKLKIGVISANGTIQFDFPKIVDTRTKINDRQNILFFDIQDQSSLNYTNGDTGYFANASLIVMKNDKQIGTLTIGNSVRVTLNLVNQSNLYSGDEGYLLYWAYVDNDCAILADEDWKGEVRRDGTNTIEVETNVSYDLNLKKGWNLVKAEVIGKYELNHERGLDVSWFKNHRHTVIETMPDGARYFIRMLQY